MAAAPAAHIFPGLAVAAEMQRARLARAAGSARAGSMENQLVPPRGFAFETDRLLRRARQGLSATLRWLPLRLLGAFWQSIAVVRRVQPDVVLGLGGYITFPAA